MFSVALSFAHRIVGVNDKDGFWQVEHMICNSSNVNVHVLATDRASSIHGAKLTVDGGRTAV
jgi:hypothetical protein